MAKRKREQRRLLPNFRFLIVTGVPLIVLALAAGVWYLYQDQRLQSTLLDRAEELEANGEYAKAAEYYYQYLQKNPENTEVTLQLAETYDKGVGSSKNTDRAIGLYKRALSGAGDKEVPRLHARLAELLLSTGKSDEAEEHALALLKKDPQSAAGMKWFALSVIQGYGRETTIEDVEQSIAAASRDIAVVQEGMAASRLFEMALEKNPRDPDLTHVFAQMLRAPRRPKDVAGELLDAKWLAMWEETRWNEADRLIDDLVTHWPDDPERAKDPIGGLILRCNYRHSYGMRQQAKMDLLKARQIAGDDPRVLIRMADAAHEQYITLGKKGDEAQKSLAEGMDCCEAIRARSAGDVGAAMLLGLMQSGEGDWETAVRTWEECLKGQGENPNTRLAQLVATTLIEHAPRSDETFKAVERFADALDRIRSMGRQYPRKARLAETERDLLRAEFYAARGEFDEAIDRYVRIDRLAEVMDLTPRQLERLWVGLGDAYVERSKSKQTKAEGGEGGTGEGSDPQTTEAAYQKAAECYDVLARYIDSSVRSKAASILAADAWLKAGHPETAVQRLSEAVEEGYAPGSSLDDRLTSLEETVKTRRAELGSEIDDLDTLVGLLRCEVHIRRGEASEVIAWCRNAVKEPEPADPENKEENSEDKEKHKRNVERAWRMLAAAYDQLGRRDLDQALVSLGAIIGQTDVAAPPQVVFLYAQLQQRSELAKPEGERSWQAVDKTLGGLRQQDLTGWDDAYRLVLFEIDLLRRRQGGDASEQTKKQVLALLKEGEAAHSDNSQALREFAFVYEFLGERGEADRLTAIAKRSADGGAFDTMVDARLALRREGPDAARKILRDAIETADVQTAEVLRNQLRMIDLIAGDREVARRQLLAMHERQPRLTGPVVQLVEIALSEGNLSDAEDWETRLRDIEGTDGLNYRYLRARRLLRDASETAETSLTEAADLFTSLEKARPEWAPLRLLAAGISRKRATLGLEKGRQNEASGDMAAAETEYNKAVEEATAALARYNEAVKLGANNPLLQASLGRVLLEANARKLAVLLEGDRRSEVEPLVDSLAAALPTPESEEESKAASKKNAVVVALFRTLADARRVEEMRTLLDVVKDFADLDEADKELTLGEGYLALGDSAEAEKHFRAAVNASKGSANAAARRRLAVFLAGRQNAEAIKEAQTLLEALTKGDAKDYRSRMGLLELYLDQGKSAEARTLLGELSSTLALREFVKARIFTEAYDRLGDREKAREYFTAAVSVVESPSDTQQLVAILLRRGDSESLKLAETLLEDLLESEPESLPVRRTLYQVRLGQGPKRLDDAKAILKDLAGRDDPTAATDCLVLAQVLEREKDTDAARKMYERAVELSESSPNAVGALAEFLLRQEKPKEALALAEELEKTTPSDRVFSLKLLCWKALDRAQDIDSALKGREADLLKKAGDDPRRKAAVLVAVGGDCMNLGRFAQAEALFRRAVEFDPAAKSALSAALRAQQKTDAALSEAIGLFESQPNSQAAMGVFAVLTRMKPDELKSDAAVEKVLEKMVSLHPNNVRILLEAATTRIRQGRADDAIKLYEKALGIAPNQPATLNNLAALLASKPDRRDEALKYVNKVLEFMGDRAIPAVLDTKGTILLAMDQDEEAVEWFKRAVSVESPEPVHLMHAAAAYRETNRLEEAKKAFARAMEKGLGEAELQEQDAKLKTELEAQLQ